MRNYRHIDDDDQKQIQMRIHKIAQHWLDREYCPKCIVRVILAGSVAVSMDVLKMSRADLHQTIDYFFDEAEHRFEDDSGVTRQ